MHQVDAQDSEITNLESQLGLTKADCRDLQNQMSLINGLFTQMLLGASSADMDLDRLTQLLQVSRCWLVMRTLIIIIVYINCNCHNNYSQMMSKYREFISKHVFIVKKINRKFYQNKKYSILTLQENHDLISDIAREESTEAAALPKLLLDLVEQVEGGKASQKHASEENGSEENVGEIDRKEDDLQEENIAHNLPKVLIFQTLI